MKECFEAVKNRLLEGLAGQGYTLRSENTGGNHMIAELANDEEKLRLEYDKKLFSIYRGPVSGSDESMIKVQTYLFDTAAGDGVREAAGVANEFLETLQTKPTGAGLPAQSQSQSQRKRNKDKNSEENDIIFFINRILTVMPECRTPLLQHKSHYEQLLPRKFCEEVVVAAQKDMLRNGQRGKAAEYFQLLDASYGKGDLDVRSVIMQVLLAGVEERDQSLVEGYLAENTRKAWEAARRLYGKKIRPEQRSAVVKMASYQAETLNGRK